MGKPHASPTLDATSRDDYRRWRWRYLNPVKTWTLTMKPIGSMDETVTIWEKGAGSTHRICRARWCRSSTPKSTLMLEPDAKRTLATFDHRYVPRGGPLCRLAGPLIDKMPTETFTDMLDARTRPPAEMVASAESPRFGAPTSAA
jgi:hypothetical protein